MRLAGQAKLGFYPANPEAIAAILKHLKLPPTGTHEMNILDPCAGEGMAIKQIADGLGIPYSQVYAVELDANRGAATRANMPGANVLSPASILGTRITAMSFGLAYVNPPFDDEIGGGKREELAFVERVTWTLMTGGVLVLVVPESALAGNRRFCEYLDSKYEDISVMYFPDGKDAAGNPIRPYNEVVVIGRRRRQELSSDAVYTQGMLHKMQLQWRTDYWERTLSRAGDETYWECMGGRRSRSLPMPVYTPVKGWKPSTFVKSQYLEDELLTVLDESDLNQLLTEVNPAPVRRPPLPPAHGHVALLLASGYLDGIVEEEDGRVHVVRGTAKKVEYYNKAASKSTENPDTGALKTVEVHSQKICLVIRAAWPDGSITTYSDEPPPNEVLGDDESGFNEEEDE